MALYPYLHWLSYPKPFKFRCNLCLVFFSVIPWMYLPSFLEHRIIIFSKATLLTMIFEVFKFNHGVFYFMLSLTLFVFKGSASIMSSTIATALGCWECVVNFESPDLWGWEDILNNYLTHHPVFYLLLPSHVYPVRGRASAYAEEICHYILKMK